VTVFGIDPSLTATGLSDGTDHALVFAPLTQDGEERALSTRRRTWALARTIADWCNARGAQADDTFVYIEAPMLYSAAGAGHLYELGWMMSRLYDELVAFGFESKNIIEVDTAKVRKLIGLPGNAKKTLIPLALYKKFGVEFEKDPGADKAFAYLLHRYGLAHQAGEIEHVAAPARGQGKRARGSVRKSAAGRAGRSPLGDA